MKNLIKHHDKHLKHVFGKDCFDKLSMNYGWSTEDYSITTKIYNIEGYPHYLTTYNIGGRYSYDTGITNPFRIGKQAVK